MSHLVIIGRAVSKHLALGGLNYEVMECLDKVRAKYIAGVIRDGFWLLGPYKKAKSW